MVRKIYIFNLNDPYNNLGLFVDMMYQTDNCLVIDTEDHKKMDMVEYIEDAIQFGSKHNGKIYQLWYGPVIFYFIADNINHVKRIIKDAKENYTSLY